MEAGGRLALRSAKLAAWLSIIPGAGQVYLGRQKRALFFFFATAFCLVGSVRFVMMLESFGFSLLQAGHPFLFLMVGGTSVIAFLGVFIYGLFLWGGAFQDAYYLAKTGSNPNAKWWKFHY